MKNIVLVLIGVLVIIAGVSLYKCRQLQLKYEVSISNVKALDDALALKNNSLRVLQLKVNQLDYFKDSILVKMDSLRKELGVKDKNLKALQYIASTSSKTDTIVLTDTVFRNNKVNVDTLIGDAWYNIRIKLKYPNMIAVTPRFISSKYVVIHGKRETINPPKKWWLLRLFQKKHTVVTVDVVEESPYVKDSIRRFVEIIKN